MLACCARCGCTVLTVQFSKAQVKPAMCGSSCPTSIRMCGTTLHAASASRRVNPDPHPFASPHCTKLHRLISRKHWSNTLENPGLFTLYNSLKGTETNNMSSDEEDLVQGEPPSINPYEVLGLDREATADQVKSAYRKAALKHHPGMFAPSIFVSASA